VGPAEQDQDVCLKNMNKDKYRAELLGYGVHAMEGAGNDEEVIA
jgi:hypothetical protein